MKLRDLEKTIYDDKKLSQEEEDYLCGRVEAYWTDHPDVTHRHPRWKKFLAWVAGYQYLDYNRAKKVLMPVKLDRKRKLVFNRLKPFVRTVLGKLISVAPQQGVVPKTTEYEDAEAANVGDLVIEFLDDKLNMAAVRKQFFTWLVLLNRACLRVIWNEDDFGIIDYQAQDIPAPNEEEEQGILPGMEPPEQGNGEEAVKESLGIEYKTITEPGDVGIEVVSPFNCRPDPLHFDSKKWRWFVYGVQADADKIEEDYELEEGSLVAETDTLLDDPYSISQTGDFDFEPSVPEDKEDVLGRTVVFKEFWTPKIFAFVVGKKVVKYGKNPYEKIPFFAYEERLVPIDSYEKGIIFNDSMVKDLIPIQREYNRWISLISLALERATKLKVMSPFDSLLNKKQIYDDGGIVMIDYNKAMGEPHQLKLDPLPAFAMQFKQELEREMESGSNVHEASFGRLPERASHASGTLVNLLVEQDDQVLDPLIRDVDKVFGEALSLMLKIVQDNYVTKRLLKIAGRDSAESVLFFEGADLRGNTDVQVTSQVGLPKSRPLRIEWIMKLRELQLIKDDKTALELMEFGQAKKIYQDELLHEKRALRENMLIAKNPTIDPKVVISWICALDDPQTHLKIHSRDRLSPKFEHYTETQKAAIELHIQATLSSMQPQPGKVTQNPPAGEETPQAATQQQVAPQGSTPEEPQPTTPEQG